MTPIRTLLAVGFLTSMPGAAFAIQASSAPHQIALYISSKGEITTGQGRVTFDELSDKVKAALKETPDLVIAIKAEKDVPLKIMTKVFDACRRAGANKFTMAPDPKDGSDKSSAKVEP